MEASRRSGAGERRTRQSDGRSMRILPPCALNFCGIVCQRWVDAELVEPLNQVGGAQSGGGGGKRGGGFVGTPPAVSTPPGRGSGKRADLPAGVAAGPRK